MDTCVNHGTRDDGDDGDDDDDADDDAACNDDHIQGDARPPALNLQNYPPPSNASS
jgi:hypothetical protein